MSLWVGGAEAATAAAAAEVASGRVEGGATPAAGVPGSVEGEGLANTPVLHT